MVFTRKKHTQKKRSKASHEPKKYLFGNTELRQKTFKKRKKFQQATKLKSQLANVSPKQWKRYFFASAIVLLSFILVFVILGPIFRVKEIFITRQGTITNINQAYDNVDSFRGKNIFFLDSEEISNRLLKSQNTLKSVAIQASLPNTINIELRSYLPMFQTQEYIILENGAIIPNEGIETSEIPIIHIAGDISDMYTFGEKLSASDLRQLRILLEEIRKNIIGIQVQKALYFPKEREVLLVGKNETLFIFDLSASILQQIQQLSIFHKEKIDVIQSPFIYIDVRIPEKLFVCGFESEFQCRTNIRYIYSDDIFDFTKSDEADELNQDAPIESDTKILETESSSQE